jgi:hypothetical protein
MKMSSFLKFLIFCLSMVAVQTTKPTSAFVGVYSSQANSAFKQMVLLASIMVLPQLSQQQALTTTQLWNSDLNTGTPSLTTSYISDGVSHITGILVSYINW